jgi:hypothetical protein
MRFQRAAQGDRVSMQEWPSHSGRVCSQRTAVQTTPPRPDTLQPGVLQFENFRELLGCFLLNPGAMGHDGGHPDPPARILVDICSSGLSLPTVDSVERPSHDRRLRVSHPSHKHRLHANTCCDPRSEGFAQNISWVLKLWCRYNQRHRSSSGRNSQVRTSTPYLLISRSNPSSTRLHS